VTFLSCCVRIFYILKYLLTYVVQCLQRKRKTTQILSTFQSSRTPSFCTISEDNGELYLRREVSFPAELLEICMDVMQGYLRLAVRPPPLPPPRRGSYCLVLCATLEGKRARDKRKYRQCCGLVSRTALICTTAAP